MEKVRGYRFINIRPDDEDPIHPEKIDRQDRRGETQREGPLGTLKIIEKSPRSTQKTAFSRIIKNDTHLRRIPVTESKSDHINERIDIKL